MLSSIHSFTCFHGASAAQRAVASLHDHVIDVGFLAPELELAQGIVAKQRVNLNSQV